SSLCRVKTMVGLIVRSCLRKARSESHSAQVQPRLSHNPTKAASSLEALETTRIMKTKNSGMAGASRSGWQPKHEAKLFGSRGDSDAQKPPAFLNARDEPARGHRRERAVFTLEPGLDLWARTRRGRARHDDRHGGMTAECVPAIDPKKVAKPRIFQRGVEAREEFTLNTHGRIGSG